MTTAHYIWEKCLGYIRDNINDEQIYQTWFSPIVPIDIKDDRVLVIQVPTRFFYEWLEEHYVTLLNSALRKYLSPEASLLYTIKVKTDLSNGQSITEDLPSVARKPIPHQTINLGGASVRDKDLKNPFIIPGIKGVQFDSQLNPNLNFDNFIEGDSNRVTRSAGIAVSENPANTAFNPLFIYGGVGLGKTHLAHAIGVRIKEKYPNKNVIFVSAEVFTKQYGDASQRKELNDFIHFYQMMDVLIIDDIFFLATKEKTQEVFFHIFNHLHQNKKQIVMTSDRAPINMVDFQERLLSRFKWGLQAELYKPEYKTRLAILESKIYRDGVVMSKEVKEYVAEKVDSNVRELEGVINSLIAYSAFDKREITIDLASKIIEKSVRVERKKNITIDNIKSTVAEYFGITEKEMLSNSKKRKVAQARQISMYLGKSLTDLSLASIGLEVGKKSHSTVVYACKQIENLLDIDVELKSQVDDITRKLSSSK